MSTAQIIIPNGKRLGSKVMEIANLTKAYGDNLLIDNLSFSLPPGGIVGVIGPNGSGKSTLLRVISGLETEFQGQFEIDISPRDCAFVPQDPLMFRGSAAYNVEYPLIARGMPALQRRSQVQQMLRE